MFLEWWRHNKAEVIGWLIVWSMLCIPLVLGYVVGRHDGYVRACKDCYMGNPGYVLVDHEDGSRTWESVEAGGK